MKSTISWLANEARQFYTHTQALSYAFARITTLASAAGVSETAFSGAVFSGAAFSGAAFSDTAFASAAGACFVLQSQVSYEVGYSFVKNQASEFISGNCAKLHPGKRHSFLFATITT